MQTIHAFVRPVRPTGNVTPEEFDRLVAELTSTHAEIELLESGALRHGQPLEGLDTLSSALARRNVRSLLARVWNPAQIRAALSLALTGQPEDAEDALEEAGIELNLRHAMFATKAAKLSIDGSTLTIEDAQPAARTLRKEDYRRAGRDVFCTEALFRLLYSRIDCVRYSPTAILPVPAQLAQMATACETGEPAAQPPNWRATRKPHFEKAFCVSCGSCFITCLNDAIVRAECNPQVPGTIERLGINYDRCRGCGLCAATCPGDSHGRKAVVMVRACEEGTPEMHCLTE